MQSPMVCLLLLSFVAIAAAYRSPAPTRRLLVLEDLLGRIEAEQKRNEDAQEYAEEDSSDDEQPSYVDEDSLPVAPYSVQFDPASPYAVDSEAFEPIRVVRRMPARYPITRMWKRSENGGGVSFYGMRG